MASASASQSEVEETMLVAARDAEAETTGTSAGEETQLDASKERSVSEAQERAGPVVSSALRKRYIFGRFGRLHVTLMVAISTSLQTQHWKRRGWEQTDGGPGNLAHQGARRLQRGGHKLLCV